MQSGVGVGYQVLETYMARMITRPIVRSGFGWFWGGGGLERSATCFFGEIRVGVIPVLTCVFSFSAISLTIRHSRMALLLHSVIPTVPTVPSLSPPPPPSIPSPRSSGHVLLKTPPNDSECHLSHHATYSTISSIVPQKTDPSRESRSTFILCIVLLLLLVTVTPFGPLGKND